VSAAAGSRCGLPGAGAFHDLGEAPSPRKITRAAGISAGGGAALRRLGRGTGFALDGPMPPSFEIRGAAPPPRGPTMTPSCVVPFRDLRLSDVQRVGGKNASLGELLHALEPKGIRVPQGFAITADAFRRHLRENGIEGAVYGPLETLDVRNPRQLAEAAAAIRACIRGAPLPYEVASEIRAAYRELSEAYLEEATDVAVRSSATAEDLPTASFAGQQETFLNVRGWDHLDIAVRSCMASLFTDRAIVYRADNGFNHRDVALSVGIQKMVRSDLASAGVIFTLDTETGFREVVLITGVWGLGETIVQGRSNPDEFWVFKPALRQGHRPIIRRELGDKARKLVYQTGGTKQVEELRVPLADRQRFVLTDDEVLTLARWACAIEEHYGAALGRATPMDLEWAKDGRTGELFIVQARPETVHSQVQRPIIELYKLRGKGEVLARGKSVGSRVGAGKARNIRSAADLALFHEGEVLVAEMTDPDWEPVLRGAAAVITDQGGRTCHAAIVSRELGIPCVVGTGNATRVIDDGQEVTASCAEGDEGKVYRGRLPFEVERVDPAALPKPRTPLLLNVANPEKAFQLGQLPTGGVGLMRIEFLISNWIGVHPMALVHPERVADRAARAEIAKRTQGYSSPAEFFVERLATGVAQIAAAFHPRPVLVRFSDFKTDEYAGLLGGRGFEPAEQNPMIGFRGASRYYDERYREGFALECAAITRVRGVMGLDNVQVMVPFCRTLDEGQRILAELARNGLRRGERGLEVWMMCEIPNNVFLIDEFCALFDGFSIGSNDLTQLTLGVDRNSEILERLFDERDPGVKRAIRSVIERAHLQGRKVGICGQAPSDYPDFAEYLIECGIDSISLNPDALAVVARRVAKGS
jgi:pyruvate,water dikinase